MPIDFIKIDPGQAGQKFANELILGIRDLRRSWDRMKAIKEIMDHNTDGSDFASVATLFGLPTGNGDEVYNLVAGTLASLDDADPQALLSRVG
jgi:hypothetical protein